MYEAESPKARATRLYHELGMSAYGKGKIVAAIAQAFREWEARGLEDFARSLDGLANPIAQAVQRDLMVRAKELRGKAIDIA